MTTLTAKVAGAIRANAPSRIARLEAGLSSVELMFTSHPQWPLPVVRTPAPVPIPSPLRVSVLDSSFNPPTLAHLALANSRPVGVDVPADFDVRLFLLSIHNADKSIKSGDATFVQRLEMMELLSQDVRLTSSDNIAIAIIDEPIFVHKSTKLLTFLRDRLRNLVSTPNPAPIQLTFLQGFDTLERLFSPRYYPSESSMLTSLRRFFSANEDNSAVLCAWRGDQPMNELSALLPLAKEFVDAGRVSLIDIGEDEGRISSTGVRNKRRSGEHDWKRFITVGLAEYIEENGLYI
jgi:nicotinamide-nucleotide adenylyltransferase